MCVVHHACMRRWMHECIHVCNVQHPSKSSSTDMRDMEQISSYREIIHAAKIKVVNCINVARHQMQNTTQVKTSAINSEQLSFYLTCICYILHLHLDPSVSSSSSSTHLFQSTFTNGGGFPSILSNRFHHPFSCFWIMQMICLRPTLILLAYTQKWIEPEILVFYMFH